MGRFPGEDSCLSLVWAVLDLLITHETNGIRFNGARRVTRLLTLLLATLRPTRHRDDRSSRIPAEYFARGWLPAHFIAYAVDITRDDVLVAFHDNRLTQWVSAGRSWLVVRHRHGHPIRLVGEDFAVSRTRRRDPPMRP